MKPQQSSDGGSCPTTAEVEAALHLTLREKGILLPKTIEDITELERTLDLIGVPTPDPKKFAAKLKTATADSKVLAFPTPRTTPTRDENLALAARNGGALSEDTRRKMDQLRGNYEAKNHRPSDGQK